MNGASIKVTLFIESETQKGEIFKGKYEVSRTNMKETLPCDKTGSDPSFRDSNIESYHWQKDQALVVSLLREARKYSVSTYAQDVEYITGTGKCKKVPLDGVGR